MISTIGELSRELRSLTHDLAARESRLAYFAALYAMMTARVEAGIRAGRFEDGPGMERLACRFASRYLSALERYGSGSDVPRCWSVAFATAERWRPIILQHLLLGMNAHINFDLGIAAAEVADDAPGGLRGVRRDFLEINAVLAELVDDVQDCLAEVSPWMGALDWVGGRHDEVIVNFSMRRARDAAWSAAEDFASRGVRERPEAERALDARAARLARLILKPGRLVTLTCLPIRLRERAAVADVVSAFGIEALQAGTGHGPEPAG